MTVETLGTSRRPRASLAAAIGALALAGCATTHVGEDWQCPLAQGTQCTSVAAADPAVRGADERHTLSMPEDRGGASRRECAAGCNPFAIFARLIPGGPADGRPQGNGDQVDTTDGGSWDDGIEASVARGADSDQFGETESTNATAATADPQVLPPRPGMPAPNRELRVPETIGRVWIAPHVDAGGVYREAAWVRIVIAPARWRLP